MKKEMNNKGFSLVELIIVIAIMAVLIGVLAPQYLKYVKSSKVSTDVTNAEQIATAINVAVADQASDGTASVAIAQGAAVDVAGGASLVTDTSGNPVSAPHLKSATTDKWTINWSDVKGVEEIKVDGQKIWPDASDYRKSKGVGK